ncbi:hypothetical protein QYF61_016738, partial [Mycteria americana]
MEAPVSAEAETSVCTKHGGRLYTRKTRTHCSESSRDHLNHQGPYKEMLRLSDRTQAGTLNNLTTYKKILCHLGDQVQERDAQRSCGNSMTGDIKSSTLNTL